jgi:hypothetical protein
MRLGNYFAKKAYLFDIQAKTKHKAVSTLQTAKSLLLSYSTFQKWQPF